MRFTSVVALLTFIDTMERVGYTCPLSRYYITKAIKRLPYYISGYDAILKLLDNGDVQLLFTRKDKEGSLLIVFNKED